MQIYIYYIFRLLAVEVPLLVVATLQNLLRECQLIKLEISKIVVKINIYYIMHFKRRY